MLPPQAIQEFQELYLKKFGTNLSEEEASKWANNLLSLYRAVYGKPQGMSKPEDINAQRT